MAKKKFYAVKNGRVPGIYKTWAECQAQIDGYPKAEFKGFGLLEDAEAYLSGSSIVQNNNSLAENQQGNKLTYAEMMKIKVCPEDIKIPMPDIEIYVDGSYFDSRYSWGFAVYSGGQLLHTAYGVGNSNEAAKLRNVAGEMSGAMAAASWARSVGLDAQGITIIHDYNGVAEWAMGRWHTNSSITAAYATYMKDKRSWINFKKVAGHTGVQGNELADRLAKRALEEL